MGWAKGEDTTAAIIYNWEGNVGAAGLTCTTPAGRHCNPYDWEHLPDEVLQRMRQRKAERAKALKEWKTMSCVLHNYTGKSLDAFDIPGTCTIRPQLPNEKRIHRTDEIRTRCFLRGDDGTEKEILPVAESPGEWAQLTIGLDSGSVGRAAASYSKHKLGLFIFVVFDIIHRMIRDTKLAVESCPAVHRAVLHYTFLTSLNYRPFNSGVWHEDKKMMLQYSRTCSLVKARTNISDSMQDCGPVTSASRHRPMRTSKTCGTYSTN